MYEIASLQIVTQWYYQYFKIAGYIFQVLLHTTNGHQLQIQDFQKG